MLDTQIAELDELVSVRCTLEEERVDDLRYRASYS